MKYFFFLFTKQNNVGVITLYGSSEEATNNIVNRLPIKYHVRFPYGFTTPKVVQIIYDNTLLCSGAGGKFNSDQILIS